MKDNVNLSASKDNILRENGNYLITGGMGALGYIFAQYFAKSTSGVVILTGRKEMNEEMEERFSKLKELNENVHYFPSDDSDEKEVIALYQKIKNTCGQLHGIVHSAGIIRDSFFIQKDKESFDKVLSIKVDGCRYLDETFKNEALDFFVMFSSISSVFGNIGQSDYSYANRYMDSYASYREQLRQLGLRSGKTVSINWPLWDVGMKTDDTAREAMENGDMQMQMLKEEEGIKAFEDALRQSNSQFIVIKGNGEGIDRMLNIESPATQEEEEEKEVVEMPDDELVNGIKSFLKEIISQHTKIPVAKIKDTTPFDRYGIDSVIIMSISTSIEKEIGRISKTLFYEYENVEELTGFLSEIKRTEFIELFGLEDKKAVPVSVEEKEQNITNEKTVNYPLRNWFKGKKDGIADQSDGDLIAIIGISGRYPMADNIYEFWDNLVGEKDCIVEIPKHRWEHDKYYNSEKGTVGKTYSKWGGFINDIEKFDPMFFKIPPIEAEFLDPQERILLETVWEAVEDAGYTIKSLKKDKVGVFVGLMYSLYQLYVTDHYGGKMNGRSSLASVANRISYLFDFKGPSIALDTMCSSSLTALNLACESIKSNVTSVAVVGGVNLSLHPSKYVQLSQGNFLSTDGRCRSFGEGGDGYVPGEGSGAIVIKSLSQAKRDGDHIYGVIRGICLNAGGKTSGYTVPNLNAQRELILETLNQSGISPDSISTVEAHGTGTALGDPIEIEALTQAYGKYNVPRQYCSIGSVKSNIGHLEAASGMAAITKVMLEMQHKKLVPSLHSQNPNPFIAFDETPFYIQHKTENWKRIVIKGKEVPRRAAISAFGAGGSNAHLILEEYVDSDYKVNNNESKEYLFLLSAKNEIRLKEYAKKLRIFLENSVAESREEISNTDKILSNVLDAVADVLRVSSESLDQSDLLCEIGVDRYALEQIKESLLMEYPESMIESETIMDCETIDDIANQIKQSDAMLFVANTDKQEKFKSNLPLESIAYTLQVGREAMEQRLAIVADDMETLIESLKAFEIDEERTSYKTGNIKSSDKKFLDNLFGSKVFTDHMLSEIKQGRFKEAMSAWVIGADFSWEKIYDEKPRRISLPTYPFSKERCWIIEGEETDCLFPYIDEDRSVLKEDDSVHEEIMEEHRQISVEYVDNNPSDSLETKAIIYLKHIFSDVLKIQYEYLDEEQTYDEYGIDSIYINNLNQYLSKQFGELPSTLFFTYKNIKMLAKYFITEHKDKLSQFLFSEQRQGEVDAAVNYEDNASEKNEQQVSVSSEPVFENNHSNDIAVIGISGRFPQAEDLEEYFENLRQGKDCIETIPKDRWDYEAYPDIKCKWGGFLEDVDKFDPQFFGIAPVVAGFMDPQERLFLEAAWSCMEDAGYTPKAMESQDEFDTRGRVAVYAGVSFNEYGLYGAEDIARGKESSLNSQIYSVANRISYLFNFGGPSLSVDTACSSSLYAVHLACNSIITGDADMAIAGGVNLMLHPSKYITLNWGSFLSTDGHCHTFGENGDGYVPGEGTGAVLLKPLWKAQQDNDHIYAVIKGSAVNHGGKTHGYSVPNPVAQSDVIQKALKKSGINPRTISYVEAHGTGTALGDPIEVQALTDVYKKYTNDLQYCPIGSVKSNIGHLEAAAGISQLLKVILQMKNGELAASRLNAEKVNPNLNFKHTPFYVQLQSEEWKRPCIDGKEYPRRAGISAFGVGGVNVHVIVEEYREDNESIKMKSLPSEIIVPFSAKTEQSLNRYLTKFLKFIKENKECCDLRDVAYTLTTGRIESTYRTAFIVSSFDELESKIAKVLDGESDARIYVGKIGLKEQQNSNKNIHYPDDSVPNLNQEAENWIKGMPLKTILTEGDYQPKKISLPTYSFEKDAYWMYSRETAKKSEKNVVRADEEIVKNDSKNEEKHDNTAEEQEKSSILSQLRELYENERLELIIAHIQSIFAEILCFPEGKLPDVEEGFFSLGLESVMTRQAMVLLEDAFWVSLDEQVFFNYSNITDLSQYILDNIDLKADIHKTEIEVETIYAHEKWSDIENISFTENFGRGNIAMIAAGKDIEEDIQSLFSDEVLEKVSFFESSKAFADEMEKGVIPDKIVFLEGVNRASQEENLESFMQESLESIMEGLKPILPQSDKQIFVYYFYLNRNDAHSAVLSAINGLLKTIMLEYPNVLAKSIDISGEIESEDELVKIIANETKVGCIDNDIRYASGKRQTRKLFRVYPTEDEKLQFRRKGVYLITGGLGSIGKELSKYLCEKYDANLILCGRTARDAEIDARVKELEKLGGKVQYIQADVAKRKSVTKLIRQVRRVHKNINGVIHLAGNIKNDTMFVAKTIEDMKEVIEPKVLGTYYLDQELGKEDLDFFMMFSAVASVFGNARQSDFCYSNRYLDCFAEVRESQVNEGNRKGKSIVINWSFWKGENSMMDEAQERIMKKQFGMVRMEKENGITALEDSLKVDSGQLILLNGDKQKLCESLGITGKEDKEDSENISETVQENENNEGNPDVRLDVPNVSDEDLLKMLMQEIDE